MSDFSSPTLRLFCFLLTLSFPAASVISQTYPLHITEEGYIFVGVQLNDSISANFILDTGAGATVLSERTKNRLGDALQSDGHFTGFRHDGDRLDGEILHLPSIAIGEHRVVDQRVGVYPPLDDYGIDGLLSLKFFEGRAFTIDFPNQQLVMLSSRDVKEIQRRHISYPLTLSRHLDVTLDAFLTLFLNGEVKVAAELDSGSGYDLLLVNPFFKAALGLTDQEMAHQIYRAPISGREINDQITQIERLSLVPTPSTPQLKEPRVIFREGLIYEALMGTALFRKNKLTIDLAGERLFVH